jgi:RND superfamily putative drug exporter
MRYGWRTPDCSAWPASALAQHLNQQRDATVSPDPDPTPVSGCAHHRGPVHACTGTLTDVAVPQMFVVAFGLSMDYEVFLLARIKEDYDRTSDNRTAIVAGLARTGPIVTAAALVLSITFLAFIVSGVTFMKMFGLGLGIAVLIDAFIVRATLVPALMKLAGSANSAPAWARRLHTRVGLTESADLPEPGPLPLDRESTHAR